MTVPISYSRDGAAAATGISIRSIDRAIAAGELVARKKGGRVVILHTDLETWVNSFDVKEAP